MKQIKFYSIIVLTIIILILAFENIAYPVLFLFFFSDVSTPITVPMLIAAALGTGLGWLSRSYSQDLKDAKETEELDSEEALAEPGEEGQEKKEDEVIEDEK
jgi:hypothetical protein